MFIFELFFVCVYVCVVCFKDNFAAPRRSMPALKLCAPIAERVCLLGAIVPLVMPNLSAAFVSLVMVASSETENPCVKSATRQC